MLWFLSALSSLYLVDFILVPTLLLDSNFTAVHKYYRALVRAGATGAWAPTEIWQRVPGTRPDKGAMLTNSKKCSKTNDLAKANYLSKMNIIKHVVNIAKIKAFWGNGTPQLILNYPSRKIVHPSCENPNKDPVKRMDVLCKTLVSLSAISVFFNAL